MDRKQTYFVIAYYIFTPIEEPQAEVAKHLDFIRSHDITCRIYISEEGINAQMSASQKDAEDYMQWLKKDPRFADVFFKIHTHSEHAFPRATVKYRKQLVAIDELVDFSHAGTRVSPDVWKQMLQDRDQDTLL
ncbi:MAG: rhodanese domain-containing protein, partial [Chlamydiales bacterium]|nr:rhodanese domain-containing protein [Chlamydiales bacterium]